MLNIEEQLSRELNINRNQVDGTLQLLKEGDTVPFIARYRKEKTGNLDEIQIRDVWNKYQYYLELEARRDAILKSIREQGKLSPELEKKILSTRNKTELEDLYLPYRPKRETRASRAREAGLEPLARWIFTLDDSSSSLKQEAAAYLNPKAGIKTAEQALRGAGDILAEEFSEDAEARKFLRRLAEKEGIFNSSVKSKFKKEKTKFNMYYDYREPVSQIPPHRILAMFRGEREKLLRLKLDIPESTALKHLEKKFILHPGSAAVNFLQDVIQDCYKRLLFPSIENEIRRALMKRAEDESFQVFGDNLESLLMAPPAGRRPVMGIDPGFRTGCKIAVLDHTGKFLEHQTIFPHEPRNQSREAGDIIIHLIKSYKIELIAVGNGTAGRETEAFIRGILNAVSAPAEPVVVMVSEAGASVYSASPAAAAEFPDFDLTVRGAISIGRRLQDPLAELVKIDPKSIGVGQYQHDVDQARLKKKLEEVVESCVNRVGVDVNLASEELLKYVAGLSRKHASALVRRREDKGPFINRNEFLKVPGLGVKAFEQCAGFLRIPGAANPLDNSAVHPERYKLVEHMAEALHQSVTSIIGKPEWVDKIPVDQFRGPETSPATLKDILEELKKPGRDPREKFQYARFSEDVKEISDLYPGMQLEGVVTNVTNFGAFVDIGVHQDGLIHISEIADRFIDDPRKFLRTGQIVTVKVLQIDEDLGRIGLSMRHDRE
jgi:protein Tex